MIQWLETNEVKNTMTSYNTQSGQSTGRIAAISEAVFGLEMTMLVLEIKDPEFEDLVTETGLVLVFWKLMRKFRLMF